jgi:predicted NUDIX family NTP pyrophosphohydrolase
MARLSAGILTYRRRSGLEVLLVHPGGPFWRKRDVGAWSIPKGEVERGEDPEIAARREFTEELGAAPEGALRPLGRIRQRAGKEVEAFAVEAEFDAGAFRCNSMVTLEWPPRSGRMQAFPEIDAAAWFPLDVAREKILDGQRPLLERLEALALTPPFGEEGRQA